MFSTLNQIDNLLSHKEKVEQFWMTQRKVVSAHSFVNLFIWQDYFSFEFKVFDHTLFVFASDSGGTYLYWPPLGERVSAQTFKYAFSSLNEQNFNKCFSRIEHIDRTRIKNLFLDDFDSYRKGHEYLYWREDIVNLKGSAYKARRHDYNMFQRRTSCLFRDYEPVMKEECLKLYKAWQQERGQKSIDDIYRQMLDENYNVHKRILEWKDELDLVGRVVEIDGQIRGYTFGYPLNPRVFCVLAEVVDLQYKGLASFIFREFCADRQLSPYSFINVMDDIGLPAVGQAKMLFRPCLLEPVYVCTQKNQE